MKKDENYLRYLEASLYDSKYIFQKILKDRLAIDNKSNNPQIIIKEIIKALEEYDDNKRQILLAKISDYEFNKYYKYLYIFKYEEDYKDLSEKIFDLIVSNLDNYSSSYSNFIFKEYTDSIDIKINHIVNDEKLYPIIITFFDDHFGIIKFSAIDYIASNHELNKFYESIGKKSIDFIKDIVQTDAHIIDSFNSIKDIAKDIEKNSENHLNESIYSITYDDELGGKTSLKSNLSDKLPLMDLIIMESIDFCDVDRKRIESIINSYKINSSIPNAAIKLKYKFKSSRGKYGSVIVRSFNYNNYPVHVYSNISINREKINYAAKYIYKSQK